MYLGRAQPTDNKVNDELQQMCYENAHEYNKYFMKIHIYIYTLGILEGRNQPTTGSPMHYKRCFVKRLTSTANIL